MAVIDYEEPVAVTRDIHWVGFYDTEAQLHCNPYLLLDGDEAVLFDPGSIPHFPVVARKVVDLVNPASISTIVVCHQDPDVAGNLAVFEDIIGREDLTIVVSTLCERLVRHYGLRSRLRAVADGDELKLQSGRTLDVVALPFLHSPGAIAMYDGQTKSLFSGDFFGAVSTTWELFASNSVVVDQVATFHQLYMPSNAAVRKGLERLATMDVTRILPQHGSVLEGDIIDQVTTMLHELPCGLDEM